MTVEANGFKKYTQSGITIGTNVRLSQDVVLQVGSQAESVTVTADVALLSTASASVGQVITSSQIENMPMNGRTPLTLAQLAYGVTPSSDPRFTRPFDNAGPSGFSMGGGQAQSNELLLDGAPDMTRNLPQVFDTTRFERTAALQLDRNVRTFPQAFSAYRTDRINNIEISVIKNIDIVEKVVLQFRAESFNAFNRTQFNGPDMNPTSGNFGRITSASNLPRTYQLALRLRF